MTLFSNNQESYRDLTIFIMPLIASFDITSFVAGEAVADNPNGISIGLANGLSKFFTNGRPTFTNDPKSLPRNPPDCMILHI